MITGFPLPEFQEQDHLMREDLQQSLTRSHIDPSALSTFQRILLTTDGTVTHMLEAYLYEQIQVVKLSEKLISLSQDIPLMDLKQGTDVISRRILLRGRISRRNFIYAESIIVPERLDEAFRDELLKTKTPIGKIWFEKKVETFKEIVDSGKEPANVLANYFSIQPEEEMLFRTYFVISNRQPTMMITEKFPESYFTQKF
ncbi:MAG: chorismate pyruvate-lyase family protein [Cyanobacteria bacterium P01_F01_bin.86]